jgi:hypothetical protein
MLKLASGLWWLALVAWLQTVTTLADHQQNHCSF